MPNFGRASLQKRSELHPDLVRILDEAIKILDFTIVWGYRGQESQHRAFVQGHSQVDWPHSRHNSSPDTPAVDLAPWPIDWADEYSFCVLAGVVKAIAALMGIDIVWGGDWDGDGKTLDERLKDLGHFQLKKKRRGR